jgi:hypothetical protein
MTFPPMLPTKPGLQSNPLEVMPFVSGAICRWPSTDRCASFRGAGGRSKTDVSHVRRHFVRVQIATHTQSEFGSGLVRLLPIPKCAPGTGGYPRAPQGLGGVLYSAP